MNNIIHQILGAVILLTIMMASCAKPVARFSYDTSSDSVPARLELKNESESEEFYWLVDGQKYMDSILQLKILESGTHNITLVAKTKKKMKKESKDIHLNPPERCLINIHTPEGDMVVELYEDIPGHRDNFVKLAEQGFYDGTIFHRVIDGFMIQGGDPQSKDAPPGQRLGSGGPGYQIPAEIAPDRHAHVKGALSAARLGDAANPEKKSSGSQFYIVHGKPLTEQEIKQYEALKGITYPTHVKEQYLKDGGVPFLDGDYTVFGRVVEGLDVIDKIAKKETDRGDRPKDDVQMEVKVIK